MIKFSQLQPGERAIIVDMQQTPMAYRKRLYALGLRAGVTFKLVQQTPLGDPSVVEFSGTRLCLRAREADQLILERAS